MIRNLMKVTFLSVVFLSTFLSAASENSHWKLSSHIEQWGKFLSHIQEGNRWDVFAKYYYSPNKRILDAFLVKTGVSHPGSFLKKKVTGLDVNQASTDLAAEGLAVAFSEHVFPGEDLEQYIPFYFYHPERLERIAEKEREILEILIMNRGKTISHPSVRDYFYGNDPEDTGSPLRNSAYYIGYKIVSSLMDEGYGLQELTIMPEDDIIEKYIHIHRMGQPALFPGTP